MNICYVLSRFLCKIKINSHSHKIEMHTKQRTEVSHGTVGEKDEIGEVVVEETAVSSNSFPFFLLIIEP